MTDNRPQWWLAAVDQHGNPTLIDGAHDAREGAEHAAHLFNQLSLTRGRALAVAQVLLTAVVADEQTGGSTESIAGPWNMNVKPEQSEISTGYPHKAERAGPLTTSVATGGDSDPGN